MNQDDSLINPSANNAGKSLFGAGDYRYALNGKIGTSRTNNYNDFEIIRSMVEVTEYHTRSQVFVNPDFSSSLSPWAQTADQVSATVWAFVSGNARMSSTSFFYTSPVIYQTLVPPIAGLVNAISARITIEDVVHYTSLKVVYMNGASIISEETILTGISGTVLLNTVVTPPVGCDGIGLRIVGSSSTDVTFDLEYFNNYINTVGTKPSGDEKVIGKLNDPETRRVYYCVYNSEGNHCIRYYDKVTNAVYEILQWSGLNYQSDYFVSMAKLDNWLAMTDRNNSPRLVDINTIGNLKNSLGSDFREFHISHHRWAPIMPPVLRNYSDGVTNNWEKFKTKYLQFAYQYVYAGNMKSRFSPMSALAQDFTNNAASYYITSIEIFIPGIFLDEPGAATEYNYFNHENVKFTSQVEKIIIVFRESQNDVWKVFKTIDVSNDDNTIVRYSGDAEGTVIATADITQPYDVVPFKAGSVEAIDNRFVFGDTLEEYPAADPPVLTNIGVVSCPNALPGTVDWHTVDGSNYTSLSAAQKVEMSERNVISKMTFKSRGKYKLAIQYMGFNGWISAGYTIDSWIYEIPKTNKTTESKYALTFKFDSSFIPPEWAVAYQIMRTDCMNIDYFMFGSVNEFKPLIDDAVQDTDQVTVNNELTGRIRNHFENARSVAGPPGPPNQINQFNYLNNVLKNKPFFNSVASNVRKTTTTNVVADASRIYIDVNNWYNASKKNTSGTQNNPINKLYYNYREGDRVRFLASTVANPIDGQKEIFDVPILEFTGRGIIVEKPEDVLWLPRVDGTNTDTEDFIIEVYTPATPSNVIYNECGEWFPILYPGTNQRTWSKSDWTYTNNGAVTGNDYGDVTVFGKYPFTRGDCHFMGKRNYFNIQTSGAVSFPVRCPYMTNDKEAIFGEWEKGDGRKSVTYENLPDEHFRTTLMRFGGKIVEESNINELNRYEGGNFKIFPSEYGRIRAIIQTNNAQVDSVGSILLVIGERESWSIYVNRATLEDLSGRTQVTLSDKFFGSYNTLLGSHGTLNPESVSKDRGNVYYWDAFDGSWIRYGRNGLTEISAYKMRTWFREIGALIFNEYSDEPPMAVSEFDGFSEELITFIDHANLPASFRGYDNYKGILFSEEEGRWKCAHSYTPEMMGRVGTQVISFKNGGVWLHESNSSHHLSFYGEKKDAMVEPVFNDFSMDVKHWQTISYISTDKWSVERILSEYRGQKSLLQSRILLGNFELREDAYWGAIRGDLNSPNASNPISGGNAMRSKVIQVLMKLDPEVTTLSLLHYVAAAFIDSPKNA